MFQRDEFNRQQYQFFMDSYSFQKEYAIYLDGIDRYMMTKGTHRQNMIEFEQGQRHQLVAHLQDINPYRFKLFGQPIEEVFHEEDDPERDQELRRRIQQYNMVMRPIKEKEGRQRRNRRQNEGRPDGQKRKVRTTITQSKLDEMNEIFRKYQEYRQNHNDSDSQDDDGSDFPYKSLKAIGEKLGLGYSTILHKYRQYRATNKVKGGALIAAMHQKRKYKKSREIEELIRRSLSEEKFYTAVELSKHIEAQYGVRLSRSIISRHLGQMGYSYKNIKARPSLNRNSTSIKQMRNQFSLAVGYMKQRKDSKIYFLDECIFPIAQYLREGAQTVPQQSEQFLVAIVLLGEEGLVRCETVVGPVNEMQYMLFLQAIAEDFKPYERENVILLDIDNKVHTTQEMMSLRSIIRNDRIHLFFIPPYSNQINAVENILPKIKENVRPQNYDSVQDLREAIHDSLRGIPVKAIQTCWRESESYIERGVQFADF